MRKRGMIILLIVLISLLMAFMLVRCALSTDDLVFMDEGTPIKSADVYGNIDAVVTEKGNCYIRGKSVSTDYLYGVKNTHQYKNIYRALDFDKSLKFVEIYAGGDAEDIFLSKNGGVIITNKSDVYLFADIKGYEIPKKFCNNARYAQLDKERVYILTTDGQFGYCDIKKPNNFILLQQEVKQFEVRRGGQCVWLLSDSGELTVYSDLECKTKVLQIDAVSQFDVWNGDPEPDVENNWHYFTYVSEGSCYYYSGRGLSNSESLAHVILSEGAVRAAVYSGGVMVLNDKNEVQIFGSGLQHNDICNGEVIAKNAIDICGDVFKIVIVTTDGTLIAGGTLPDSSSISVADLVESAMGHG